MVLVGYTTMIKDCLNVLILKLDSQETKNVSFIRNHLIKNTNVKIINYRH